MTANVMVQQHSNGHDAAMQTTVHKQHTSGSEAIWFSRFLSRKSRKNSSSGPIVSVASVHVESPPASPTAEVTVELTHAPQPEQASKNMMVVNTKERPLATKKSSQTLKSKKSFRFMSHRKTSIPELPSMAAAPTEPCSSTQQTRKKNAAYIPKHAGSDFSQVAIPTTYRDSYASMYSSGSDIRPSSSATTPPEEHEPRRHASVGNLRSSSLSNGGPALSHHASADRGTKSKRSVAFLMEADRPLSAKKSTGCKGSIAPHNEVLPSSLFEKYVSDGLSAPPQQQKQPKIALRTQSTPDIRSAAAKASSSTSTSSSSSRVYAKYRQYQQQHALQNIIFTVPEYDREASRPTSSATTATATNSLGLHPPPSQPHKSRSVAPHSGQTSPRKLSRRESSASIGTHRSGQAVSGAGSIHGDHSTGISSFGRKLSEYIKPSAISETNAASAQYSSRGPSLKVADE